jgi:metal-responsive CopG/Arc/MetJ family transcriptional regulator
MVKGMRTTIAIDEKLLQELMRSEGDVSRSEAIRHAIEEYLRARRIEEFINLGGSGLLDMDWREAEQQDMKKVKRNEAKRKGSRR